MRIFGFGNTDVVRGQWPAAQRVSIRNADFWLWEHLDTATRLALEALYSVLLSAVVQLAKVLGKPSPVLTRAERRQQRENVIQ